MPESTAWHRLPFKDVGISYEEIACLLDPLYKDDANARYAVISIQMGEDCERIQDFPESYLEITKEDLENGVFGL